MATSQENVPPEDSQSQWVGEATIKGKSQVTITSFTMKLTTIDCSTGFTDYLPVWTPIYMYFPHPQF
jgi:hypothetical protein